MKTAHATTPAFMVPSVSGMRGFPASSFTGETLVAQRMEAILMKSELFAMCRPMQVLLNMDQRRGESSRLRVQIVLPWSKSLKQKVESE